MITAVILARCDSSRLPKKHFLKIGNKSLIKLIINNLEENILISQIYLATGTKKKNKLFEKHLNFKKEKKIKIYYHRNSTNVTERIYFLTKKIKTRFTILISGDCCLVDNFLIKRLYNQIIKKKNRFY